MYEDLIAKARELCDKATPGPWKSLHGIPNPSICQDPDWDKEIATVNGSKDYGGWRYHQATRDADLMSASRTLIPQLCDALEAAEKELIDYHHAQQVVDGKMAENARLRRINEELTARAEKAEMERDEAAWFIKWVDTNFGYLMPKEYEDRIWKLEINHSNRMKGE